DPLRRAVDLLGAGRTPHGLTPAAIVLGWINDAAGAAAARSAAEQSTTPRRTQFDPTTNFNEDAYWAIQAKIENHHARPARARAALVRAERAKRGETIVGPLEDEPGCGLDEPPPAAPDAATAAAQKELRLRATQQIKRLHRRAKRLARREA